MCRVLGCVPAEADPARPAPSEVNQVDNVEFGVDVGDGGCSNGAPSFVFSSVSVAYQHLR